MSVVAVVIMAKAPEAYKVKTRLTPPLDPETASGLYCCFLLDKLEQVRLLNEMCDICPVVAYTPSDKADLFESILPPEFILVLQTGSDLGERLANVSGYLFEQGYERVIMLDSDSPNLPTGYICDSMRCLDRTDIVIGPCLDGGYYLIGLGKHMPGLFQDIPWSTPGVTASTIERAVKMGISVSLIDEWYDVDTVEDLMRLKRDMEDPLDGSFFCRHTYRMGLKTDI